MLSSLFFLCGSQLGSSSRLRIDRSSTQLLRRSGIGSHQPLSAFQRSRPRVVKNRLLAKFRHQESLPLRPNIILITLDTTRADRMGFLGSQLGLTPHLDQLAKQGVVFTRAYSHVSADHRLARHHLHRHLSAVQPCQ